jgi:prephenate dehydratase
MTYSGPMPRVAFQGERGAFSEEAARALLGSEIELAPRPTFEALFTSIDEGQADYILAPIENSLVGSVQPVYDLIFAGSLFIAGEVIIPISHSLIGCPKASFAEIASVESHPVALAQCGRFFAEHPHLKRIVAEDTAGSVANVIARGDLTRAAIAGKLAAQIYGGAILREHLEDHPENYTRFVLLARSATTSEGANKLSLILTLSHQPGALHEALAPFAQRGVNLLKIESRPVKGSPWRFRFCLDLQGSTNDPTVAAALRELEQCSGTVRLLGCYPAARTTNGHEQKSHSILKEIETNAR